MKLGLFALVSAAAITVCGGTVSAQQVVYPAAPPVVYPAAPPVVYPGYSPGVTIGGAIRGPGGVVIGGTYSTAPAVPVAPVAPVAPVVVAPAPVIGVSVGVPLVRYGYYPYYGRPYYYHRR